LVFKFCHDLVEHDSHISFFNEKIAKFPQSNWSISESMSAIILKFLKNWQLYADYYKWLPWSLKSTNTTWTSASCIGLKRVLFYLLRQADFCVNTAEKIDRIHSFSDLWKHLFYSFRSASLWKKKRTLLNSIEELFVSPYQNHIIFENDEFDNKKNLP
jgi:hypothetical protein